MFPFNLTGGAFLMVYACIAVTVLFAFRYLVRSGSADESDSKLGDLTADPYRIGCLRGSAKETLKLAVVNLIDRGLVKNEGQLLEKSGQAEAEILRRPLDRAILKRCEQPTLYDDLAHDRGVMAACNAYEMELSRAGLLRRDSHQNLALLGLVAVIGLLGGMGIARIVQALSHGRTNVLFLAGLAIFSCIVAWKIFADRRTFAGIGKLASLETLMARLKARSTSIARGGATNEALLLASVFGLEELPRSEFPYLDQLFPRPRAADTSSWSSDRSSGSDSSCGSSSSCGGGGGSGCGGCGGGGD